MQGAAQSEPSRRGRRPPRVPASVRASLREERRRAILSLRSNGLTIHAIATELGIDDNTVRSVLSSTGDPRPLRERRPTPCIFEGCNRPRSSKTGYCAGHARQLRDTGTVKPFHSRLNQQQEVRREREQEVFALRSTGVTMQTIAAQLGISQPRFTGHYASRATRARRSSRGRSCAASTAATEYPTTAQMATAQHMKSGKNKDCRSPPNCCAHPTASERPASSRAASGHEETRTATARATHAN